MVERLPKFEEDPLTVDLQRDQVDGRGYTSTQRATTDDIVIQPQGRGLIRVVTKNRINLLLMLTVEVMFMWFGVHFLAPCR
jgi:hypothetical protein